MQEYEQKYLNNISKNIKLFRENRGFSQEYLAERVDCSREFINRIENRKEDVSLKMLLKLSFVLEVTPQQLLEEQ